jgi:hypothetical protein
MMMVMLRGKRVEVCLLDLCFVRSHRRDCLFPSTCGPCSSALVSVYWLNGVEKHMVEDRSFDAAERDSGVKVNPRISRPAPGLMNDMHLLTHDYRCSSSSVSVNLCMVKYWPYDIEGKHVEQSLFPYRPLRLPKVS